ncbi:MAG: Asp-tRNA(Asn)/Glu-tRNA(Gln) amidotransferase subunit GatB [Desulfovibrio sp.]|jgi:aspartyl-tRNA(Asn)/glutamyl-tRNA(Gln) amidotransferase subunit B|nr:Asp-tRNA(Asn)/Glu-tRNA(Gln) amidotransferase subunit GatB [Desulfovibrio sp.]
MASYEAVIGLEVHAHVKTSSKLFCSCPTDFGAQPNEHVCEVCAGMPGALPRLNEKAVELAAKAGLALHCKVNAYSLFARKNYFYPDLPNGYQTSQFSPPICEGGHLDVTVNGDTRRIGITRIHMEDDAGKCVHGQGGVSLVDLNRAGVPLIEIVSEPDIRCAEEAAEFMRQIHAILVYIGATDGNMEEGSLRCDANVSIRPKGEARMGTRSEVKNLNSFRNVQRAIEYEISRQTACLEDGVPVLQETRLFDAVKQMTQAMRSKEDAHDYRYFPNPDLPPVLLSAERLAVWREELPELPAPRIRRFMRDFGLSGEEASALISDKAAADYFEEALAVYRQPRRLIGLMQGEFLRECASRGISPAEAPMPPASLAGLAAIIDKDCISARMAHEIFPELFASGTSPEAFVAERGMVQVSDAGELDAVLDAVFAENPVEVKAYRGGKTKLRSFFVGKIMQKTQGKANPALVNELLLRAFSL